MIPRALLVAHETDASLSTSTGTKSHKTFKQSSQFKKSDGVIDGTISIM